MAPKSTQPYPERMLGRRWASMIKDSRPSVGRILIIGLLFHLIYIGTVFDCYFTSPVVHGMKPFSTPVPLAKRLVLIVADGLRADLLFTPKILEEQVPEAPEIVAPYLREIVEARGAWGISHTRVPTESRPGHVAIIGGMYEDVSAVTRGWKTNPVDFDSVFNRSAHTFSFGSPDILPMFAHGAAPGKVDMWCYDESEEDFTKDATALDIWVLDHLRSLFHNASSDPTLDAQLRQDGTVFFLHLLGLDTTGHSYRPFSKEYMTNIQTVDTIVRQVEHLFDDFYSYSSTDTVFVFTADHGMSRRGNHGDGDPDNTRTPFVAWGSGIRGPLPSHMSPHSDCPTTHDAYSIPFNLTHLLRSDVEQADIAAMMATLVGTEWPVNGVGVVPDIHDVGYLDFGNNSDEGRALVGLVNAKVILEHYRVKHEHRRGRAIIYRPYPGFENSDRLEYVTGSIEKLIEGRQFDEARTASQEAIKRGLEGLRYLETYDRTRIRFIVTVAYLGWIAYSATYILFPVSTPESYSSDGVLSVIALSSLAIAWAWFLTERSPWTYHVYVIFPIFFWHQSLSAVFSRLSYKEILAGLGKLGNVGRWFMRVTAVVSVLYCMVLAYTHRPIWSLGFFLIGVVWPLASGCTKGIKADNNALVSWVLACVATGIFPLLGVERGENLGLIMLGGAIMTGVGIYSAWWITSRAGVKDTPIEKQLQTAFAVQLVLILATMVITAKSTLRLQAKIGLSPWDQAGGWTLLALSALYPFFSHIYHPTAYSKLLSLYLALCPCFVLLSLSVEGLFYTAYTVTLITWVELEGTYRHVTTIQEEKEQNTKSSNRKKAGRTKKHVGYRPRVEDLRIALVFLFFVQVGFFGTGNVASISTFYLEPVFRLLPTFRPFTMAALLVFKIVAPYVMLAACFATLNARLSLPPFSLFLVSLTITDVMTMVFFYNVTDTGSWLEIGQSISFFCISSLLLVWSAGICVVGEKLMAEVLVLDGEPRLKEE